MQTSQTNKKLTRSCTNRVLGGVCGGLGEYLNIDVDLIRVVFVLTAFGGFGIAMYLILWILIPAEGAADIASGEAVRGGMNEIADKLHTMTSEVTGTGSQPGRKLGLMVGGLLILWGTLAFARSLHISWLWWLDWDIFWPLALVVLGIALILRRRQ